MNGLESHDLGASDDGTHVSPIVESLEYGCDGVRAVCKDRIDPFAARLGNEGAQTFDHSPSGNLAVPNLEGAEVGT